MVRIASSVLVLLALFVIRWAVSRSGRRALLMPLVRCGFACFCVAYLLSPFVMPDAPFGADSPMQAEIAAGVGISVFLYGWARESGLLRRLWALLCRAVLLLALGILAITGVIVGMHYPWLGVVALAGAAWRKTRRGVYG